MMPSWLPWAAGAAVLCTWLAFGVGRRFERRAIRTRQPDTTDAREREVQAREQAVAQERERIFADLHDDLGAKLLTLIHQAESPAIADLARTILQDLRDVVTRSRGTSGGLGDVLADIRGEARQRLAAVGIELIWDAPDDLPEPGFDTSRALHLYRIVREAISNVIRHAQARRLRVRIRLAGEMLRIELTDDGGGVAVGTPHPGSGMRGMRERAAELDGDIRWSPGTEGGTKVLLAVPLVLSPQARSGEP